MNKSIKTVLEKPMDRKDFLKHVGVGALLVAGGGIIVNALKLQGDSAPKAVVTNSGRSYSSSVYGR